MKADRDPTPQKPTEEESVNVRCLGAYGRRESGPLVILVAGQHGNEPATIEASRRVMTFLMSKCPRVRGRVVAFAGNLAALAREERLIDTDLNRMWTPGNVARIRSTGPPFGTIEEAEQHELVNQIEREAEGRHGRVFLIDLHSTSADSPPFCIIDDTLQNRRLAFAIGIPVILGLEESILGTIQQYFGEFGWTTAAIEGGQHRAPQTVGRLEAAIWMVLVEAGVVGADAAPEIERRKRHLTEPTRGLPPVVEIIHRHAVSPDDGFRMRDGFANFHAVHRGQPVAVERRGDIRVQTSGMLIMPNYQSVGDDGFFVGRTVNVFWLRVSAVVRRLGLDRLLPLLPGVTRHPRLDHAVLVDPDLARWLVPKVFHLFGFRKLRSEGDRLVFRRRREHRAT